MSHVDEVVDMVESNAPCDGRPRNTPGSLREIRALEVLERIGTPEARKLIEAMAGGADAIVTYEAQLILTRWQ